MAYISSSMFTTMSSLNTRKGMVGLASGINTNEVIEKMTLGTRSRIAQLLQKQTKVAWKMEAYQNVTSSLLDFKTKFMSAQSLTNMRDASFYQSAIITAMGANAGAVTVTGSMSAALANFSVKSVSQMATTTSFTSSKPASQGAITSGEIGKYFGPSAEKFDRSTLEGHWMNFVVDGRQYSITLSDIDVDTGDIEKNMENIAEAINKALGKAGLGDVLSAGVRVVPGDEDSFQMQISVKAGVRGEVRLEGASDKLGLGMNSVLGFAVGATASAGQSFSGYLKTDDTDTYDSKTGNEWLKNNTLTFNLNGTNRTISFGSDPQFANAGAVLNYVNDELGKAFGTVSGGSTNKVIATLDSSGRMVFETKDTTSILAVSGGSSAFLGASGFFGIEQGAANRLLVQEALSKVSLNQDAKALVSDPDFLNGTKSQDITVNGTRFSVYSNKIVVNEGATNARTYTFSEGTSIANITSVINSASVGVRAQYNSATDNFTLVATESGTMGKVEVGGALGRALFGDQVKTGSASSGAAASQGEIKLGNTGSIYGGWLADKSLTFELDGVSKTISFGSTPAISDADELRDFLNAELATAFGPGKVTVSLPSSGGIVFKTGDNGTSALKVSYGGGGIGSDPDHFGVGGGLSNRLNMDEKIFSNVDNLNLNSTAAGMLHNYFGNPGNPANALTIEINGMSFNIVYDSSAGTVDATTPGTIKLGPDGTLADVMNAIGNASGATISYNAATDRFVMSGVTGEIGGTFGKALFGDGPLTTSNSQAGQDAVLTVSFDGGLTTTEITRSSNSFTLNGMNVTLNNTFFKDPLNPLAPEPEAITFAGKPNTDLVFDAIKDMVTAYNEMIDKIGRQLYTRPDRSFQPLTSEQRRELSASEIEQWEAKAKEGLLYGDPLLSSLMTELRFAFSTPVGNAALNQIGIKSSSSWQDNGKLIIDESVLRRAIEGDAENVAGIFTKTGAGTTSPTSTEAGVMARIDSIMEKYTSTYSTSTGARRGLLIERAGHESAPLTITNNALYREMRSFDSQLKTLQARLEREETRYLRQFAAMENYLSAMNQQSSWLAQAFSTDYGA